MDKKILVLDVNREQCRRFCELLHREHYATIAKHSLRELGKQLAEKEVLAVFIDIDTVAVDNRMIRDLTLKFPGVYFFCLSERPFHPELKDAICYHIYACLRKPVDTDELFYLLQSIGARNQADRINDNQY